MNELSAFRIDPQRKEKLRTFAKTSEKTMTEVILDLIDSLPADGDNPQPSA